MVGPGAFNQGDGAAEHHAVSGEDTSDILGRGEMAPGRGRAAMRNSARPDVKRRWWLFAFQCSGAGVTKVRTMAQISK